MKHIILSLVSVAFCCLITQEAQACSCPRVVVDGPTDPAAVEAVQAGIRKTYEARGGAVFTGEVVKVEKVKVRKFNLSLPMRKVTVRVETYWVGVAAREVVVFTGRGAGSCGVAYAVGKKYLFRADNLDGRLETNICSHVEINDVLAGWYDEVFGGRKNFPPS